MPSKQEAVILAIQNALAAHPALVMREEVLPQECPPEGLINILDEDAVEVGYQLGSKVREWQRGIELEIVVFSSDVNELPDLIDAASTTAVELLMTGNYGDLITSIQIGAPQGADDIPMSDAVYLRGASIPATLFFETSDNPMERYT